MKHFDISFMYLEISFRNDILRDKYLKIFIQNIFQVSMNIFQKFYKVIFNKIYLDIFQKYLEESLLNYFLDIHETSMFSGIASADPSEF